MILIYPSHHFAPDLTDHLGLDEPVVHADDEDAFEDRLEDADIILTNHWNDDWNQCLDGIGMIQITSAGYDHLPVATFTDHGVAVANASGVHGEPIPEHIFAYLLGIERNLFTSYDAQQRHDWREDNDDMPGEIAGSTMTIIGVGAIGAVIAGKAQAFDMEVNGIDPDPRPAMETVDTWYTPDEREKALETTDHLVLACPLTETTRGMIGQDELSTLPDDAVLLNIARGAVIERQALQHALETGTIGAAVLDVTWDEPLPEDSPFWDYEKCLISPHIAGLSPRYGERLAALFEQNYQAFLNGDPLPTGLE